MSYKKTGPTAPSKNLASRRANHGTSCSLPPTTKYNFKGGTRRPDMNPNFEVKHQDEPTTAHPVSQHKNMAGDLHGIRSMSKPK